MKTYLTLDGQTRHIREWIGLKGLDPKYTCKRLQAGDPIGLVLRSRGEKRWALASLRLFGSANPLDYKHVRRTLADMSRTMNARQIAEQTGLSKNTVLNLLHTIPGAVIRPRGGWRKRRTP
jgi:hypothetical protein